MLRLRRAMPLGIALALLCGCAALPSGATEQALEMHRVWVTFAWIGFGMYVLVAGLILWCVVRYRARPQATEFPPQFRRNDRLEVFYTVVPLALVVGLFAIVYPVERHVETLAPTPRVVVDVTGFRWSWRFRYPALGVDIVGTPAAPPEFDLPLGGTTRFEVSSADVDHSFWVPEFLFKRDAIPGLRNVFDWTPNRLGSFRGECGEYCGLQHALMAFEVKVVTPAQFAAWTRAHRTVAVASGSRS